MELTKSRIRRALGGVYRRIFGRAKTIPQVSISPDPDPLWWHRGLVEHLAFIFRPKVYVELGLYRCELFNRIVPYAEHLIGVDMDPTAGDLMVKSQKTQFVCSTTEDFAKELQSNPMAIDLLFIDADHARDAVLKDVWDFFPFVVPHGLIILHDTHPKNEDQMQRHFCDDAYKAAEELAKASDRLELMTLPLHPGLTLCRKRRTQLSWMENAGTDLLRSRRGN